MPDSQTSADRRIKVTKDGPSMVLQDAEPLCAFARFCDNAGTRGSSPQSGWSRIRLKSAAARFEDGLITR
jgi:hypothetical protein